MEPLLARVEREVLERLPDRFDLADVTPEKLAPLFALVLGVGSSGAQLQSALAERLLDITVRQAAAQTEFYTSRFESFSPLKEDRCVGLNNLGELPVVERGDVEAAGETIQSRFATYGFSTFTTGTTSGLPLVIDRSSQEQLYVERFFTLLQAHGPLPRSPGLALILATLYHGQTIEVPGIGHRIRVSVSHLAGCRTALRLLRQTFRVEGGPAQISAIGGHLADLLRLTAIAAAEAEQGVTSKIGRIQSTGQYMTVFARRRLENFWGCEVDDRFGVSELLMGAWRCAVCSDFHFDPFGIPEVIDRTSPRPIRTGRGRLGLTSYYPFSQMTPLIRYLTGDLVEIPAAPCPTGATRYRILGRVGESLSLEEELGPNQFLSHAEVLEVLEPIPDLCRRRGNRNLPESLGDIGMPPTFRLARADDGAVELTVEVCFDPSVCHQRAAAVRASILSGFLDVCPFLVPLVGSQRFRICLSLTGPLKFGRMEAAQ